jgi:predicted TIM-barrel fold metal-dependent hydrolase
VGAVVYPTYALGYGRIPNPNWANAVTRAYNDWLTRAYCSNGSPLKGMALIPMQDPQLAIAELRRAVTELGMPGAMLPSTGLRHYLGDREYWPVYEAANDLGCALAVHGGAHQDLGLDRMRTFPPVHALGHPFGIMANFASMVFNGVFERFPNVRFAFLEGGVSWLLLCLERFGGSARAFQAWDPDAEYQRLTGGDLTRMLLEKLRNGQLFVGVEGDELGLSAAVKIVGAQPFVFSSDYPHEVNAEICRHEIEELLENEAIEQAEKEAILFHNAAKLYDFKVPARV